MYMSQLPRCPTFALFAKGDSTIPLLIPRRRHGTGVLRKRLQRDFSRPRRGLLIRISRGFREPPFQYVVGLVPRLLPFSALDRPLELERHAVHHFSREDQRPAIELAGFEELIKERPLVAVEVAITRDESRDAS